MRSRLDKLARDACNCFGIGNGPGTRQGGPLGAPDSICQLGRLVSFIRATFFVAVKSIEFLNLNMLLVQCVCFVCLYDGG